LVRWSCWVLRPLSSGGSRTSSSYIACRRVNSLGTLSRTLLVRGFRRPQFWHRPEYGRPYQRVKNPSLGRINTHEPLSSGNTNDAALHQEVGYRKTHRRGPCPRSPNLEDAREQRPREKPCPAIALRGFQRAPGTGKLLAYYSNGPSWKTQLPAVLPHSGRGLPGPFRMRYSLGTIHGNQIQETIVLVRHNRVTANEHASHPSMERVRWHTNHVGVPPGC